MPQTGQKKRSCERPSLSSRDYTRHIAELVDGYSNETVLGMGGSFINWVELTEPQGHPGIAIVITDNNPFEFLSANGVSSVRAQEKTLPFKSNTFDKVVVSEVVDRISQTECKEFLIEICRVLKPEGILCIYASNRTYFGISFVSLFAKRFLKPRHANLKVEEELVDPLFDLGFGVVEITRHSHYFPVWRTIEQLLLRYPPFGNVFRRRLSIRAEKRK